MLRHPLPEEGDLAGADGALIVRWDLLVIGAGPAGAGLAWLLAREGWRVLLLDDGRRAGGAVRETVLPGSRPVLERCGLWPLASSLGEPDRCRHGAIWGEDRLTWRGDEPGTLFVRGRFDRALRRRAEKAGATRWSPARALAPLPPGGEGVVRVEVAGRVVAIEAGRIVVATGRRDAVHLGGRSLERGPETVALTVRARCPAARSIAVVEAVPSGWWWWIGDGGQGGTATLVADLGELHRVGVRDLLDRARGEAFGPPRTLEDAKLCRASRATSRRMAPAPGTLWIGDAAATVDPLSSQGIEKALSAAEDAAAVLRAGREHPSWWPDLVAAHDRWERDLFAAYGRTAREFLRRERRFADAAFWARREEGAADDERRLPARGERLGWRDGLAIAEVPDRFGETFRMVPGLVDRRGGDALVRIGPVSVAAVMEAFHDSIALDGARPRFANDRRLCVLRPEAVEAAVIDLCRRGWLRACGAGGRR